MKLVIVSDTHENRLSRWKIPDGDVLIHCGDCSTGTLTDLRRFGDDLHQLPHKHKLVIAGNHDVAIQKFAREARDILAPFSYLQDEAVVIDGLKFYGAPWQPDYLCMAFNLPRCSAELEARWAAVPSDTDVLITHCPPEGILDWVPPNLSVGCQLLRYRLGFLKPLLHCFGHVHESRGCMEQDGALFVNAACVQTTNQPVAGPVVVEIDSAARRVTADYCVMDSLA